MTIRKLDAGLITGKIKELVDGLFDGELLWNGLFLLGDLLAPTRGVVEVLKEGEEGETASLLLEIKEMEVAAPIPLGVSLKGSDITGSEEVFPKGRLSLSF